MQTNGIASCGGEELFLIPENILTSFIIFKLNKIQSKKYDVPAANYVIISDFSRESDCKTTRKFSYREPDSSFRLKVI